jgi:hypothetical protein
MERKMTLEEFLAEKWRLTDKEHSSLILEVVQKEKDLSNLKEQVLMLEGFLTLLSPLLEEYKKYLANEKI